MERRETKKAAFSGLILLRNEIQRKHFCEYPHVNDQDCLHFSANCLEL